MESSLQARGFSAAGLRRSEENPAGPSPGPTLSEWPPSRSPQGHHKTLVSCYPLKPGSSEARSGCWRRGLLAVPLCLSPCLEVGVELPWRLCLFPPRVLASPWLLSEAWRKAHALVQLELLFCAIYFLAELLIYPAHMLSMVVSGSGADVWSLSSVAMLR